MLSTCILTFLFMLSLCDFSMDRYTVLIDNLTLIKLMCTGWLARKDMLCLQIDTVLHNVVMSGDSCMDNHLGSLIQTWSWYRLLTTLSCIIPKEDNAITPIYILPLKSTPSLLLNMALLQSYHVFDCLKL